jgi:hypothetical protein
MAIFSEHLTPQLLISLIYAGRGLQPRPKRLKRGGAGCKFYAGRGLQPRPKRLKRDGAGCKPAPAKMCVATMQDGVCNPVRNI